ncbi:unnamed protein product [Arctia plantaginis]|uniref:Single domain-containing protein n=1 Tax=Arctia plantaginis TaxID=874455 RepID=A0A8S1B8G8_ARCPL|nr:unnamed protein product [Arctia plantaginis]CAB3255931.1 unnamed protein product [Arctia plantaginis]
MVSKVLIFVLIVGTVSAATWRGKPPVKPEHLAHKEGCYVKEIDDVIPFGETVTPLGYCYRIHCSSQLMDYASCGAVFTDDPKCHKTETDLSKPYPSCCPDIRCDLDNHIL